MIILRQKEFGNKANKAAKRLWEISQIPKEIKVGNTRQKLDEFDRLRKFRKSNKPEIKPLTNFYDSRGQQIISRKHGKRAGLPEKYLWRLDHTENML